MPRSRRDRRADPLGQPRVAPARVREILRQACDRIDPQGGQYDAMGRSHFYGHGRLNAARAKLSPTAVEAGRTASATRSQKEEENRKSALLYMPSRRLGARLPPDHPRELKGAPYHRVQEQTERQYENEPPPQRQQLMQSPEHAHEQHILSITVPMPQSHAGRQWLTPSQVTCPGSQLEQSRLTAEQVPPEQLTIPVGQVTRSRLPHHFPRPSPPRRKPPRSVV